MSQYDVDLFVIGGGSGGVRAARMAANMGIRVALAEADRLGGTCVIRGCVPKKLLSYGSHLREDLAVYANGYGLQLDPQSVEQDWPTLISRVQNEVSRLEGVYHNLLDSAGVLRVFSGHARLLDPHQVEVAGERIRAETILIATGGYPTRPDLPGAELGLVSDDIFLLERQPKRIAVYGAGYVAVEFAAIFAGLGSETHLIYRREAPLKDFDQDIRAHFVEALASVPNLQLHAQSTLGAIKRHHGAAQDGGPLSITINSAADKAIAPLEVDAVLLATGRRPNSGDLNLAAVGVETDAQGRILVDPQGRSSVPSIYAVGDVSNRYILTPVALAEAMAFLSSRYQNQPSSIEDMVVPTAVFSNPQIATVGLSEAQARAQYDQGRVYRARFRPMKLTLTDKPERILMKLVTVGSEERVVGAHMVGPDAAEIMQGLAVAIRAGATKAHFDRTIGIHPTAAEEFVTMREVADDWGDWDQS